MPRVPTLNAPQVAPGPMFTERVSNASLTPSEAAAPFESMKALGDSVSKSADVGARIALDAQKSANDLRVADGLNRVRQAALDAAYDPTTGYMNLKGLGALERPGGVSLTQEYMGKFDAVVGDIANTLGNDAQRAEFMRQAQTLGTSFSGDLQKHTLGEYTNYHSSVADGTIKLSQQEAALHYNNPERVAQAIDGVEDPTTGVRMGGLKQAIYNKAKLTGASANEAQALMEEAESNIHSTVVQTALTNNNPTYAMGYFEKNRSKMVASDILKVQGMVNTQVDAHLAMNAVREVTKEFAPAFQPNALDRLVNIVSTTESGMRQLNADGTPVTSPKGAIGIMQVMPATAQEVAKKYKIEWDDKRYRTDAAYNRKLGTLYLNDQIRDFGDVGQALAAYNAGPGATREALKRAEKDGGNYLQYLPKETQDYVAKNVKAYSAGLGAPELPTKLALVNAAVSKLGDNPRPEAVKLAQDSAEKQYTMLVENRKEQANSALDAAQRELLANGGNFAALTPATLIALNEHDPENFKKASDFAKAVSSPVPTNPEAYANAVLHTDELAALPEPALMQYLKTNFDAGDQQKILEMVKEQRSGTGDNSVSSINSAALNTALEGRLESIGIVANPKKDDTAALAKVGNIQRFIRSDLYALQKQLGHKLSPEDIEKRLDKIFTTSAATGNGSTLWNIIRGFADPLGNYTSASVSEKGVVELTVDDIPDVEYKNIMRVLEGRGISTPPDDVVVRMYQQKVMGNAR